MAFDLGLTPFRILCPESRLLPAFPFGLVGLTLFSALCEL